MTTRTAFPAPALPAALAILAAAALLPAAAPAKVTVDRSGAAQQATTPLDFLRHPDDGKYYTESWTTILHSDQGHVLYVNFMYTNIGVTSGRAAVSVNLTMPGGQGKPYGWEYDQDDYREDFDTGTIRIGPHSLTLQGKTARYRVEAPDLRLSLTLAGWTGGVKFHDGTTCIDEPCEEWVKSFFHIPRGDFEGELAVGGQRIRLQGAGYLDHMVNNQMSSKWSSHWWTTRYFAPGHTLAFVSFRTRKDRGGETVHRLLLTDRTRVLACTDQVTLKADDEARDPNPRGHAYARRYTLAVERPRLRLAGTLSARRLHDRDAVLERLPWAQRTIAQAVAGNPVIYRSEGAPDLVLTLEGEEPVRLDAGTALMEAIVN